MQLVWSVALITSSIETLKKKGTRERSIFTVTKSRAKATTINYDQQGPPSNSWWVHSHKHMKFPVVTMCMDRMSRQYNDFTFSAARHWTATSLQGVMKTGVIQWLNAHGNIQLKSSDTFTEAEDKGLHSHLVLLVDGRHGEEEDVSWRRNRQPEKTHYFSIFIFIYLLISVCYLFWW